MTELHGPVLNIDWDQAVTDLVGRGWTCAPRALAAAGAALVAEDDGRTWHVAGDEGDVRQHVIGSYSPYADALPAVRAVGDQLVAGLTSIARQRGLPSIPAFNEATWGRYPAGVGHITVHRDPTAYGGVIAVFTLAGKAAFRAWDSEGRMTEWLTEPGQLVVLHGLLSATQDEDGWGHLRR